MRLERLKEIQQKLVSSGGWDNGCTPDERKEIVAFWRGMPGYTCFHDAVNRMIREHPENVKELGRPVKSSVKEFS